MLVGESGRRHTLAIGEDLSIKLILEVRRAELGNIRLWHHILVLWVGGVGVLHGGRVVGVLHGGRVVGIILAVV